MRKPRRTFAIAIGCIIAATLLIDRLIFSGLIFFPENRSGWDSFRWYNFEYHFRSIPEGRDERPLVLIVGSSIAQYSVQKNLLEPLISERFGREVRLELLVHAAMLPTDLKYYADRILELDPALIVYITNPGDLDLERYSPPWEASPPYSAKAELGYLDMRFPVRIYYPAGFAFDHWRELSVGRTLSLFLRETLYSVRYRGEWIDPIEFSLKVENQYLKSYLYYQGVHIPEGVFVTGETGASFSFSQEELAEPGILYTEIPAALANAGASLTFYAVRKRPEETLEGEVWNSRADRHGVVRYLEGYESELKEKRNACAVPGSARRVAEYPLHQAGWKSMGLPPIGPEERYFVRLSHVMNGAGGAMRAAPGDPCYVGRGLRLPGNFGLRTPRRDDYLTRRPTLDDLRLHDLERSRYVKDYGERIQPDGWQAERRIFISMNLMRMGKLYTNWFDFEEIPQAVELMSFLARTAPVPVLILNNPENPIAFDDYGNSRWYKGYLDFMRSLAKEERVQFEDLSTALPENHFVDPHHLTYYGMLKMAPLYARSIVKSIDGLPTREGTRGDK